MWVAVSAFCPSRSSRPLMLLHLRFPLPFHRNHFMEQLFLPSGTNAFPDFCIKEGSGLVALCVWHIHQQQSMWFCLWDSFVSCSMRGGLTSYREAHLAWLTGRHTSGFSDTLYLSVGVFGFCPSAWLWSLHSVNYKTQVYRGTDLKSGWRQVPYNYLTTINDSSWVIFWTSRRNLVPVLCLRMYGRKECYNL